MPDISTNAALAAAGYTTAPSPSYGLKLVLRDGEPVGHFDCQSAWDLPGMREVREAPAALATSRKLDRRLDLLNRGCVRAMRAGQRISVDEHSAAVRLILAGATDAGAVLADVRAIEEAL